MASLKQSRLCEVVENLAVGDDTFRMVVRSPEIAGEVKPGQFVSVRYEGTEAYLRRPFSICAVNLAQGAFEILYQIKGKGTQIMSRYRAGEFVDVLGPLGNGFQTKALKSGRAAIIGGGIGVFPLLLLARKLQADMQELPDIYLGYRDQSRVLLQQEFTECSSNLIVMTEDGSVGGRGYVTEPFQRRCEEEQNAPAYQMVYACGPETMLRSVQRICADQRMELQLSLEQRMGCGIGACLVCACALTDKAEKAAGTGDVRENSMRYGHVCKEGPVFRGDEVIFE